MASLILAHALSIVLVGGLRFGPAAVLAGASDVLWVTVVAMLSVGVLFALGVEQRQGIAPWGCRGRLLLWLVFPGAAAVNWGMGNLEPDRGVGISILTAILGLVIAVLFWRRAEWADRETSTRAWVTGGRWLVPPTAAVAAAGFWYTGHLPGTGLGFITYPLYGGMQLAAALVLPWTQWARDDIRPRQRVAASTLLFALVHWANPFATITAGVGMLIWASAWRAGSGLLPLALSFGIMATVVTQSLPDELTAHMRVAAPHAIKTRELAHARWLDERAVQICRQAAWSDTEGLRPWLGRTLRLATRRDTDPALIDATAHVLERMYRGSTLRWILDSGEFRARNGITQRLKDRELSYFDSSFAPFEPAHAPYERLVDAGAGLDHRSFVSLAYRELLGRETKETEYRYWPVSMSRGNRVLLVRRVLVGEEAGDGLRNWRQWKTGPEPDDLVVVVGDRQTYREVTHHLRRDATELREVDDQIASCPRRFLMESRSEPGGPAQDPQLQITEARTQPGTDGAEVLVSAVSRGVEESGRPEHQVGHEDPPGPITFEIQASDTVHVEEQFRPVAGPVANLVVGVLLVNDLVGEGANMVAVGDG